MRKLAQIATISILMTAIAVVAAEWWFSFRAAARRESQPLYYRLLADHAPFARKYAHPEYGFIFTPAFPPAATFSNESVRLSNLGFRGPGPDEIPPNRRLAFLVGDSVVFGLAPHDSLTITGFLNRLQDEFFFINAGAPSWVSGQMLARLNKELLALRPSLIVFWGGHNDASVAYRAAEEGLQFDPTRIEGVTRPRSDIGRTLDAVIPHVTDQVERLASRLRASESQEVDPAIATLAAQALIQNVKSASRAALAAGAEFLAVYQPILHHHAKRPPGILIHRRTIYFERFLEEAGAGLSGGALAYLDLSSHFDSRSELVRVFTPGAGPDLSDHVFVDQVHLYVPGNEAVARAIWQRLQSSAIDTGRTPQRTSA